MHIVDFTIFSLDLNYNMPSKSSPCGVYKLLKPLDADTAYLWVRCCGSFCVLNA